ncbi:unnamed protein product [Leuciscus chuanchicus]
MFSQGKSSLGQWGMVSPPVDASQPLAPGSGAMSSYRKCCWLLILALAEEGRCRLIGANGLAIVPLPVGEFPQERQVRGTYLQGFGSLMKEELTARGWTSRAFKMLFRVLLCRPGVDTDFIKDWKSEVAGGTSARQ